MMVSDHKARSVFDRYNIVSDQDLRLAALRQEDYLNSQMGTISGTIYDFEAKKTATKNSQPTEITTFSPRSSVDRALDS